MFSSSRLVVAFVTLFLGTAWARDPFKGLDDVKKLHVKPKISPNERIAFQTPYGRINVKLFPDNAPNAVAIVRDLAVKDGCENCNFYRNEARSPLLLPEGPPYGLLQGEMDVKESIPLEGSLQIKTGYVAFIPDSKDFLISLQDHPEWETSHTVIGEIEDFVSTDLIAIQPHHIVTHEKFGTKMRMMNDPVSFTVDEDTDTS